MPQAYLTDSLSRVLCAAGPTLRETECVCSYTQAIQMTRPAVPGLWVSSANDSSTPH